MDTKDLISHATVTRMKAKVIQTDTKMWSLMVSVIVLSLKEISL